VVAVVATKVAQVMGMDLQAAVAMDLALDRRTIMGHLAVMVEVMDRTVMDQTVMAQTVMAQTVMAQIVMVLHTMVDRDLVRLAAMDPQVVVATEVLPARAAAEAVQTEAMEPMAAVAPVTATTVDPLQVAVMGLEPVGAMVMVQLAATEVLAAAAMEQADKAVATEQVQVAVAVMVPGVVAVAVTATVKAIRCQSLFSLKALMFSLNVWKLLQRTLGRCCGSHRSHFRTCSQIGV